MLTLDPTQRITTEEIERHPWFLGGDEAHGVAPTGARVRQVGRFSCQAAQSEENIEAPAATTKEVVAAIPPPPLASDDQHEAAAMSCEEEHRCDTPASRVVIMGHAGEPAAASTFVASRSSTSCKLDAVMELYSENPVVCQ